MMYVESGPFGRTIVRTLADDEEIVAYQLHLLTRDRPAYLLPAHLRFRSGEAQICCDWVLEKDLASQPPDPQTGRRWLNRIAGDLADAQNRLFPPEQFCLDPSLIVRDSDERFRYLFLPVVSRVAAAAKTPATDDMISARRASWAIDRFTDELTVLMRFLSIPTERQKAFIDAWKARGWAAAAAELEVLYEQSERVPDQEAPVRSIPESAGIPATPQVAHADLKPSLWQRLFCRIRCPNGKPKRSRFLSILVAGLLVLIHLPLVAGLIVQNGMIPSSPQIRQRLSGLAYWAAATAAIDLMVLGRWLVMRRRSASEPSNTSEQTTVWQRLIGEARYWLHGNRDLEAESVGDSDTQFLDGESSTFRMAMLSTGKPGTPDELAGQRAFMLIDDFLIGRDPRTADLVVDDPGVGRSHARIVRRAGSFFLTDLGSRNGTMVDDRRLSKHTETLLPDECRLQFAGVSFYFTVEG